MRFKNSNQRKAVMAKLTYSQLRAKGVRLNPYADSDRDGVKNYKDCRPLNAKEQGLIHDLIKKKNQYVKKREKELEKKQDKMLREIDSERTKLKRHLEVQKQINDNKKLKQELAEIKAANFRMSRTGKILASSQKAGLFIRKHLKKYVK